MLPGSASVSASAAAAERPEGFLRPAAPPEGIAEPCAGRQGSSKNSSFSKDSLYTLCKDSLYTLCATAANTCTLQGEYKQTRCYPKMHVYAAGMPAWGLHPLTRELTRDVR